MLATYLITALVAYLLGSIPFGLLLVRVFRGTDVREKGSGNIGATNVARAGGRGLGLATLLLDALKGYLAVVLSSSFTLNDAFSGIGRIVIRNPFAGESELHSVSLVAVLAGFMAIVGHCFPVWLRFKGGKGVATGLGVFLAIAPKAVFISVGIFVLVVGVTRFVSLGSAISAAIFPLIAYSLEPGLRNRLAFALVAASSLLIILKHYGNCQRIFAGTEHRLGTNKSEEPT